MANDEDSKDEVGYKKPPRQTQFKPGQSGNPKGRPKGARNFTTVLDKELRTRIPITENGKRKTVSKIDAVGKQLVNKAVAGDPKAATVLLNEFRQRENRAGVSGAVASDFVPGPQADVVIDNIVRRIRSMEPASESDSAPEPQKDTG